MTPSPPSFLCLQILSHLAVTKALVSLQSVHIKFQMFFLQIFNQHGRPFIDIESELRNTSNNKIDN